MEEAICTTKQISLQLQPACFLSVLLWLQITTPVRELGLSAQPGWGDVRIKVHRALLTASLGDNPPAATSAYFSKIAGPRLAGFPASG